MGRHVNEHQNYADSERVNFILMKRAKLLLTVMFIFVAITIGLSACGGGFTNNEPCENRGLSLRCTSGTRRFVTDRGTERFYCSPCAETCRICGARATEHITNRLDFLLFFCSDCA